MKGAKSTLGVKSTKGIKSTDTAVAPSAWNPTTFANVLVGLPQAYYDPKRLLPKRGFRSAMARLETAVPEVVAYRPDAKGAIRLTVGGLSRTFATTDLDSWMAMGDRLLQVLRWVDGVLGDRSNRDTLQYAAIKGALDVLDPHTTFFTPEEYRSTKSRFTGSVVGVGVYLRAVEGRIVVSEVLAKGPAVKAGVRAGDVLVAVGALTMANLNPTIASERLRGKAGTKVKIVVQRRGRRITFVITRAEIVLPSVTTRMLAGSVALITITGFPKNGLAGFKKALGFIRKSRPKAYLLDLRGNEGGYIQQAVRMADFFLDAGVLVKAVGRGGQKKVTWEVKKRSDRITEPLVVLMNRRTASAAEILAGALSTAGRTLLLGERTWGKGTVQKLFPMKDGSALKLTMWQYLLRGDIPVQTAAIVPDVELVPVRISSKGVRYLTAARSAGEAGQARAIGAMKGKKAWVGRPVMKRVRYLVEAGADPMLDLGRKVVLASPKATRAALLSAARPLVAKFLLAQRKAIGEKLKKRGVNWSRGAVSGGGAAGGVTLTATVVAKPSVVRAGKPFNLVLTIRNGGTKPVYQVGAVFAGYASMIDGRELLVGRIAPGKSRTVNLDCQAPPGIRERWERVRVKVSAQGSPKAAAARLLLRVHEKARPSFRFHWQVDDRRAGNGDGILDAGESAALVVYVQNIGSGAAAEVRVDATEPVGGLVITRARAVFAKLGSQATAVARLAIRRLERPDPRGRRPGVTLTLYDKTLGGDVVQTIALPRSGMPSRFAPDKRVVAPLSDRVVLSGYAGPDGQRMAKVTPASRLVVEARRAAWLRVTLPGERFAFVSASDVKPVEGDANQASGVTPHWSVVPPRLKLTPGSGVAKSALHKVSGQAFATGGVQDLWVRVWNPESKHRAVDKLVYRAAPKGGVRQLEVSASVRLLPGTNYVAVDARDMGGAQGQHRIAVFLPAELADKGGPSLASGTGTRVDETAKKSAEKKSGCGCRSGGATEPVVLLVTWVLLLGLRRRRQPRN
jgi:carboxyl-terminal processing protease